jgi:hypothetical protein
MGIDPGSPALTSAALAGARSQRANRLPQEGQPRQLQPVRRTLPGGLQILSGALEVNRSPAGAARPSLATSAGGGAQSSASSGVLAAFSSAGRASGARTRMRADCCPSSTSSRLHVGIRCSSSPSTWPAISSAVASLTCLPDPSGSTGCSRGGSCSYSRGCGSSSSEGDRGVDQRARAPRPSPRLVPCLRDPAALRPGRALGEGAAGQFDDTAVPLPVLRRAGVPARGAQADRATGASAVTCRGGSPPPTRLRSGLRYGHSVTGSGIADVGPSHTGSGVNVHCDVPLP